MERRYIAGDWVRYIGVASPIVVQIIEVREEKLENKKAVCEHFGLKFNPDRPLVAMISRLVEQKGLDLIRAEESELMNMPADFVFLGTGADSYC